jgi:rhamnulose-1-phosphate aldolase/alcohol dehydrogenase
MDSRWSDTEAAQACERYADLGEDLALRVYTSRLIGCEPDLVLHGGGNTSVKSRGRDLFGDEIEVLHIKGSGWNLATIEPAGLPAVALAPLRRLRDLDALGDEQMVAQLRAHLLDPAAPNPSVEALLHAFLPHRYIDHSHADAILALTNQIDGERRIRELYGERVEWVPYVMPGLALAQRCAEIFEKHPRVEGLVLEKHGLFTFGEDARTSYERHIDLVRRAEEAILGRVNAARPLDARPVVAMREATEVAHVLRGALAVRDPDPNRPPKRWILEHRASDEILHFAAAERGPDLARSGPITPDHVIRTKGSYLFVERPPYGNLATLRECFEREIETYRGDYRAYVSRCTAARGVHRTPLDPSPRVVVLPGIGLFAAGETREAARIAADIAEHTIRTKIWAASIGEYQALGELDLFDMEYWSLEQAKLGKRTVPVLEGQVALVTGAAGAIGFGVARRLIDEGACVALVDRDEERLQATADRLGTDRIEAIAADVTDPGDMADAFARATGSFGGVDLVVANAGVAAAGALDSLALEDFERAVDVNLKGTFLTLQEAIVHMKRQGSGGNIVLVSTKNVPMPGAEFGAYSASKAGAHQLARIAALEGAEHGIRVNLVNADAVFGDAANPSGLWREVGPARASARGIDPGELEEHYRARSLLKIPVTAEHVGNAVVFFAAQETPTTGAALPVDAGLAGAFLR